MPGDTILFEDEHMWATKRLPIALNTPEVNPPGVVQRIENVATLDEMKAAKNLTVIGMFPCTYLEGGTPAVLFSKRGPNAAFGGKWGAYGGTFGAYVEVIDFIANISEKECGLRLEPQALIGIYCICAPDKLQAVTEFAYAARFERSALTAAAHSDQNHGTPTLLTLPQVEELSRTGQSYWSAIRAAQLLLKSLEQ